MMEYSKAKLTAEFAILILYNWITLRVKLKVGSHRHQSKGSPKLVT